MKRNIYVVINFLALALLVTGCTLPKNPEEIAKTEINSVLNTIQINMKAENVAQVVDCYTDPYIDTGESVTHEELTASLQTQYGYIDYDIYEFINRQITVTGSEAEVICDLHLKAGEQEQTVKAKHSMIKTTSGWKITETGPNS